MFHQFDKMDAYKITHSLLLLFTGTQLIISILMSSSVSGEHCYGNDVDVYVTCNCSSPPTEFDLPRPPTPGDPDTGKTQVPFEGCNWVCILGICLGILVAMAIIGVVIVCIKKKKGPCWNRGGEEAGGKKGFRIINPSNKPATLPAAVEMDAAEVMGSDNPTLEMNGDSPVHKSSVRSKDPTNDPPAKYVTNAGDGTPEKRHKSPKKKKRRKKKRTESMEDSPDGINHPHHVVTSKHRLSPLTPINNPSPSSTLERPRPLPLPPLQHVRPADA